MNSRHPGHVVPSRSPWTGSGVAGNPGIRDEWVRFFAKTIFCSLSKATFLHGPNLPIPPWSPGEPWRASRIPWGVIASPWGAHGAPSPSRGGFSGDSLYIQTPDQPHSGRTRNSKIKILTIYKQISQQIMRRNLDNE